MAVVSTRGASMTYSRTGTGIPVLLIQGVGATGDAWRPQVEGLRDRFSLITFDNRGIGASKITDGSLSIEAMADDALAILDAEGIDRCHVVGHSMGGHVVNESTAWSVALGVGMLVAAARPAAAMGLAIVGGVFTLVLTGYVVVDGLTGAVGAVRMLSHLPALAGVVLTVLVWRRHPLEPPRPDRDAAPTLDDITLPDNASRGRRRGHLWPTDGNAA